MDDDELIEGGGELVEIGTVSNEQEAAMVVDLLRNEGLDAHSDASDAAPAFGGLPFEPGHRVFVPRASARQARKVLEQYPHFQDRPEE